MPSLGTALRRALLPTESQEQRVVVAALRAAGALFAAVPNGAVVGSAHAGRLKAEGLEPGAPDLLIFAPVPEQYRGIAVEMKRQEGGRVSPEQAAFHARLTAAGWLVIVAAGARMALGRLRVLGVLPG